MTDLASLSPAQFAAWLRERGRSRAAFVCDEHGRMQPSHPDLAELAAATSANTRDFARHEAVFLQVGPGSGALFGAFLHDTRRGQGAGGVRHWRYSRLDELITDGLRLSRGMGRKNALAGLWWGGGKGVIAAGETPSTGSQRQNLFREYGQFISSLRGLYVTAEDVGTTPDDIAEIHHTTRHVTCVPPLIGGSGNPSIRTAEGVVRAMEGALDVLELGDLQGKRIAIQGTGNVGNAMIGFLLERGVSSVVAAEISPALRDRALSTHGDPRLQVRLVAADDLSIYGEECDVFAPCALGGGLGPDSIGLLKARVVCGAANNQLLDDIRDGLALSARGIAFVPDFVANRMGIVNCANEQYGFFAGDPAITRHFSRDWEHSVFNVTQRVLRSAEAEGITPSQAANQMADERMRDLHPIWGHRGKDIVAALLSDDWANGTP